MSALPVDCPHPSCSAKTGQACRRYDGTLLVEPHRARRLLAAGVEPDTHERKPAARVGMNLDGWGAGAGRRRRAA